MRDSLFRWTFDMWSRIFIMVVQIWTNLQHLIDATVPIGTLSFSSMAEGKLLFSGCTVASMKFYYIGLIAVGV